VNQIKTVTVNGRVLNVIQSKPSQYGAIVLVSGWNDVTPFVVWTLAQDGSCHWGAYCETLEGAIRNFKAKN
jgi:hypothetical protein